MGTHSIYSIYSPWQTFMFAPNCNFLLTPLKEKGRRGGLVHSCPPAISLCQLRPGQILFKHRADSSCGALRDAGGCVWPRGSHSQRADCCSFSMCLCTAQYNGE
ncbi:hypothetical protein EYF80_016340 [Liparis tanakae]|uniref:Uncharacterized protein n=1 Tax=Liparis tanakae TaxID=230148 RepID=A0A4Z2I5S1_9TELE|nr:hypothetical protein EYF80_016340 [Liparis tanakae]